MTQIYLIRHAEAEGNLYRRIHGWYNSLITENGYKQLETREERFRDVNIDAAYSSDLFRTMTTAGAIFRPKGLLLQIEPNLREVKMGDWEDHPWAELEQTDADRMKLFSSGDPTWQAPHGESYPAVQARALTAVQKIAAENPDKTVAVFSHGMAIRAILTALHGLPIERMKEIPHGDNTAVNLLQFENGQGSVIFENDATHLPAEISTLARQKWWKGEGGMTRDANLYYRLLDLKKNPDFYYEARKEAWVTIHGSLLNFDGDGFLFDAKCQAKAHPNALWQALLKGNPAGLLQLDIDRDAEKKIGWIPFFYMLPEYRRLGIGVQMLGQAVSVYRPLGREYLRLRCAPDNEAAQRFYARNGFRKVGEAQGTRVPLDILQKYIGY
ncbi:MAG: bifunctional histidine phosphatase family protein/GNAT family N-acetyltransferase [Oscillospiraceae bacterium]